jgi:hypothetical protein
VVELVASIALGVNPAWAKNGLSAVSAFCFAAGLTGPVEGEGVEPAFERTAL